MTNVVTDLLGKRVKITEWDMYGGGYVTKTGIVHAVGQSSEASFSLLVQCDAAAVCCLRVFVLGGDIACQVEVLP